MRRCRPQRRPAEFLHITRTQNETLEGIAAGSLLYLDNVDIILRHTHTCMSVFCYINESRP